MSIVQNIQSVRDQIALACARSGRSVEEVTLIAVSKTHPASDVLEAIGAGVTHFGENRVEESSLKIPDVAAHASVQPLTWHMIGHVQSRKAKEVVPLFDMVHSVDSVKLGQKLAESARSIEKLMPVLLEINISGEQSKEGFEATGWADHPALRKTLWQAVMTLQQTEGIRIQGLMTLAPYYADVAQTRPVFHDLALLRNALQADLGLTLPILSMGMTNDYPVAIEEGATMIRVGRAIFGER